MGDRDNLVFLGFKGRLDFIQGNNTPEFGYQRIYLGAICLQARVEELVSIGTKPPDVNVPVGEGVSEVAGI